jgi:hypothetical protein
MGSLAGALSIADGRLQMAGFAPVVSGVAQRERPSRWPSQYRPSNLSIVPNGTGENSETGETLFINRFFYNWLG